MTPDGGLGSPLSLDASEGQPPTVLRGLLLRFKFAAAYHLRFAGGAAPPAKAGGPPQISMGAPSADADRPLHIPIASVSGKSSLEEEAWEAEGEEEVWHLQAWMDQRGEALPLSQVRPGAAECAPVLCTEACLSLQACTINWRDHQLSTHPPRRPRAPPGARQQPCAGTPSTAPARCRSSCSMCRSCWQSCARSAACVRWRGAWGRRARRRQRGTQRPRRPRSRPAPALQAATRLTPAWCGCRSRTSGGLNQRT